MARYKKASFEISVFWDFNWKLLWFIYKFFYKNLVYEKHEAQMSKILWFFKNHTEPVQSLHPHNKILLPFFVFMTIILPAFFKANLKCDLIDQKWLKILTIYLSLFACNVSLSCHTHLCELRNKTCFLCLHSLGKTEANVWENSMADQ